MSLPAILSAISMAEEVLRELEREHDKKESKKEREELRKKIEKQTEKIKELKEELHEISKQHVKEQEELRQENVKEEPSATKEQTQNNVAQSSNNQMNNPQTQQNQGPGFFKELGSIAKEALKNRTRAKVHSIFSGKESRDSDGNKKESPGKAQIAVFLVIIIHLIDILFLGLMEIGPTLPGKVILYVALAFMCYFLLKEFYYGNFAAYAIQTYAILTVLSIGLYPFLGYILSLLPIEGFVTYLSVVAMIVPPWYIYLTYSEGIRIPVITAFIGGAYIAILFALIITASLTATTSFQDLGIEVAGVNPSVPFQVLTAFIVDTGENIWENIKSTFDAGGAAIDRRINQTLGLGYQGEIEQVREQTGVFIEDFAPLATEYRTDENIIVFGALRARSFTEQEVPINLRCEATRGQETIQGVANPPFISVARQAQRPVRCEFEPGLLSPGRYTVTIYAEFDFQTTSYTEHFFVGSDQLNALRDGELDGNPNWNSRMRVPNLPTTVYTRGPVSIGMQQSSRMPIEVTPGTNTEFLLRFGAENRERSFGEIKEMKQFTLRLPNNIELHQCTLPMSSQSAQTGSLLTQSENYKTVTFLASPGSRIVELGCLARITNTHANNYISGTLIPIVATIVAEVDYRYELFARTHISVVEVEGVIA
ncbi:MAG: hypothetical protein ACMXX7_00940 [Candidatus Woesearchaeota archaeon]